MFNNTEQHELSSVHVQLTLIARDVSSRFQEHLAYEFFMFIDLLQTRAKKYKERKRIQRTSMRHGPQQLRPIPFD
jgi:hypothetical protein